MVQNTEEGDGFKFGVDKGLSLGQSAWSYTHRARRSFLSELERFQANFKSDKEQAWRVDIGVSTIWLSWGRLCPHEYIIWIIKSEIRKKEKRPIFQVFDSNPRSLNFICWKIKNHLWFQSKNLMHLAADLKHSSCKSKCLWRPRRQQGRWRGRREKGLSWWTLAIRCLCTVTSHSAETLLFCDAHVLCYQRFHLYTICAPDIDLQLLLLGVVLYHRFK